MPIPLAAAYLGASAISSLGNFFSTQNANQQNFENQVKFWNMQNQYNLPTNQKQRLLDANLSPGLMYGGGGVQNTASSVNLPDMKPLPVPDLQNTLAQYQDIKTVELQQKQIEATINEKKANQFKIFADTVKSLTEGDNRKFDLSQKQRLADTSFQLANESLQTKQLDNARKVFENSKMNEMQKLKAQQLASDIQLKMSTMNKQQVETEILKAEQELRAMGTSFQDSFIIRDLVRAFNYIFGNPYKD